MAATGGTLGLAAQVLIYLGLGDKFHESMSVSPMDMDVGDNLILGWGWISSHDLRHLYANDSVSLQSGPAQLQLDLLPATARAAARTLTVISHGKFRLLLRHVEREAPVVEVVPPVQTTSPRAPVQLVHSQGWSRPVHADHAKLAAVEAATRQAARARRSPCRPVEPQCVGCFADSVEVHKHGTELHLTSFCLADAELRLTGSVWH